MEINTKITVDSFADYEENQSELMNRRFEHQGLVYYISYAEFLDCPVEEVGITFLSTLKGYSFGTKDIETKDGEVRNIYEDFDSLEEIAQFLENNDYVFAPVYAYIHGSIALSLSCDGQFSDRWDSGTAGFLCISKARLRELRGVKRLTQKVLDKELEFWESLIEDTEYWLNGDIYDVQIETKDGEFVESFVSYGLYNLSKDMERLMERNEVA